MVYKTTFKPFLSLIIVLFCAITFGYGQSIFDNPITGTNPGADNPYTTGQNVDANITVSGIGRSPDPFLYNPTTPPNNRYGARSWSTGASIDVNDYFEFKITPNSGYKIDFVSLQYNAQRSTGGPPNIEIRSSIDGYTSSIGTQTLTLANTPTSNSVNLATTTFQNIATSITFRIYAWGAGAGTGTFSINDFTFNGTVSAIPACGGTPTTWSAGAWDNGVPDLSTPAVIATNYNTATNGSFSACSLTVNAGVTLTINDEDNGSTTNDYVVVQNDVIIDGTIAMEPKAAFVQIDDLATVTGIGTAQVAKETAPMNNWYEYTYWSSPVTGAQIGTALTDSDPNRRFIFNAQNFLDATAETGNNDAALLGQDDIDDNGDDWQSVNGSTVMVPGVGYASTHSEAAFIIPPGPFTPPQFRYVFEGLFNYGTVYVPIYRNDDETNDNNWNLIGNPYPSAIDADLFLSANTNLEAEGVIATNTIDGAIFLWSQNTAPSNTANGNQILNFSSADYAIINGTGQTAGGDGLMPERKIPSGQAFFVSMSDTAPGAVLSSGNIYTADVVFNNSMRVRGAADNSQFFKETNSKNSSSTIANKLWIDLTSDNGVFNQTLIGYMNGASNGNDGAYFDAKKNASSNVSAIIYTTIQEGSEKFAIQGKAANSLSKTEVIKLGFATNIDVTTLYTLSIAQLQGEFLTQNAIYLKDNLTGKIHNLKECDYTFTSEVGEFNNRFVVMFSNTSLSTEDIVLENNTLKIIDLDNDQIQFTVPTNLKIKNVSIFDLLGREIYKFSGQNSSEIYTVPELKNTIYIAKVTLSNGTVITKKTLKS